VEGERLALFCHPLRKKASRGRRERQRKLMKPIMWNMWKKEGSTKGEKKKGRSLLLDRMGRRLLHVSTQWGHY